MNIPPKNEKNQNKTSMAKVMGSSDIQGSLLVTPGPVPMYGLNPPLIGHGKKKERPCGVQMRPILFGTEVVFISPTVSLL